MSNTDLVKKSLPFIDLYELTKKQYQLLTTTFQGYSMISLSKVVKLQKNSSEKNLSVKISPLLGMFYEKS